MKHNSPTKLESLIQKRLEKLKRYFWNETTRFGIKSEQKGLSASCQDIDRVLLGHLLGPVSKPVNITVHKADGTTYLTTKPYRTGFYAPGSNGKTKWLALDFDGGKAHANPLRDADGTVRNVLKKLEEAGFKSYLEKSGGGEGWHIWIFFREPVPCAIARKLGLLFAPTDAPLVKDGKVAKPKSNQGIEVFPKQFAVEAGGLGNFVWLPWAYGVPKGASQFYRERNGQFEPFEPKEFIGNPTEAAEEYVRANWKEQLGTENKTDLVSGKLFPANPYNPPLPPDTAPVLKGCEFLKHCNKEREHLSESEWYSMAGIMAFLPEGRARFHKYSRDYSGYSSTESNKKFDQAKAAASGPRTCNNIAENFDGCACCEYRDKVRTPVQIGINAAARRLANEILTKVDEDPGSPLEPQNITALSILLILPRKNGHGFC